MGRVFVSLPTEQAHALLACAEVGHEGCEDEAIAVPAWQAIVALRRALDPSSAPDHPEH